MTRLGDTFIKQLHEKGEDFTNLYAFSEFLESIGKDRVPDTETVPIGLRKMKELGIKNAIIEMDLVYRGIDYKKFKVEAINDLLRERLRWIRKNLAQDAKVFINLRDLPDGMVKKPKRIFKVIRFLSSLPKDERPFGLVTEESTFQNSLVCGRKPSEERWTHVVSRKDTCWFMSTTSGDCKTALSWNASPTAQTASGQVSLYKEPPWAIPVPLSCC